DLMGSYADAFEREAAELIDTGEELRDRRQGLLDQAARLEEYGAYAAREDDIDLERGKVPAGLKKGAEGLRALAAYFERKGQAAVLRTQRVREEGRGGKQRAGVREALRQALE